jgi:signal transduction histidine kinase
VILHAERKIVSIAVSNTGPGIPEAHFPRIFERFYRADASRSLETGGNGLGLSICREIIMAHGGEIRFESKGGMTAFVIELPQDL